MRKTPSLLAFAFVEFHALNAFAQGTAAQREACTPDAIRLCSDTIPDVVRTTACMKAHTAELSPACRAAVVDVPPYPARVIATPAAPPAASSVIGDAVPRRHRRPTAPLPADPDAEVAYVPPRRVIEPPVYGQPGPVIFPAQPYPDGTFCSPPYDFCEPTYVDPNDPE